jgi:hypothetical protein
MPRYGSTAERRERDECPHPRGEGLRLDWRPRPHWKKRVYEKYYERRLKAAAYSKKTAARDVATLFRRLADEWSRETMHISSASDLINNKRYQEIVSIGWDAVPYLLTDLQQNKRFWFPALAAITGVRPFDPIDASSPRRMTEAWVKWGRRKGLI